MAGFRTAGLRMAVAAVMAAGGMTYVGAMLVLRAREVGEALALVRGRGGVAEAATSPRSTLHVLMMLRLDELRKPPAGLKWLLHRRVWDELRYNMARGMKVAFRTKRFRLEREQRQSIVARIDEILRREAGVAFAYVHGSFARGEEFGDIDVAVYLMDGWMPPDRFKFEVALENLLEKDLPYPVDVRLLNGAPLSFCYRSIQPGIRVAVMDDGLRTDFEEGVWTAYFDFAPFRRRHLREVLGLADR